MNAYELADLIGLCGDGGYNQDAANMLRQQADRIAELEKQYDAMVMSFEARLATRGYEIQIKDQQDRIADLETAVTFLRKALDDTLDALSSSIEFTKAIQERSRNERGL